MALKKISDFPTKSTLSGDESILGIDEGINKQFKISDIITAVELSAGITPLSEQLSLYALESDVQQYFEQSLIPTEAKSGDMWRDTDLGVLAILFEDGTSNVWMEI
jgi:hypothetical protein